jgi:hypothetical protein
MKHFVDVDTNGDTAGVVDSRSSVFESGVVLLNILAILILNISADWSFKLFRLLFKSSGDVPAVNATVRKRDFLICYDYSIRVFSIFHW